MSAFLSGKVDCVYMAAPLRCTAYSQPAVAALALFRTKQDSQNERKCKSSAVKSNIVQITLSKMNGIIEAQLVK